MDVYVLQTEDIWYEATLDDDGKLHIGDSTNVEGGSIIKVTDLDNKTLPRPDWGWEAV